MFFFSPPSEPPRNGSVVDIIQFFLFRFFVEPQNKTIFFNIYFQGSNYFLICFEALEVKF